MDIAQLILHGILWGSILGVVFCAATLVIGWLDAAMLLNDYPPDIRAKFGAMSEETRRKANIASLPLLAAMSLVVVMGFGQLRILAGQFTFINTFIVSIVIFQMWNLIDLVILDWFLLMTLKPRFMILPGTEGLAGYRDFVFHFKKFLRGIFFTLFLSVIVAAIALLVEALI